MKLYGKYRGLVVDRNDPKRMGRLLVTVPSLFGVASVWAEPCFPWTGPNAGQIHIPPVNAGVWVEFEAGDPNRPIWSGGWYAAPGGELETPQEAQEGYPDVMECRTESGFVFVVDERPGQERVRIEDAKTGLQLVFDRAAQLFRVAQVDESGNPSLSIELDAANGRVLLQEKPGSALRVDVNVAQEAVTLEDGTREVRIDRAAGLVRLFDGANEILMNGAAILAGAQGGPHRKLLDERFLDVFNEHTHQGYNQVTTSPPSVTGAVDAHTTTVLKGG